ncbi:MAG: hypothetical protein II627_01695 [Lachnospiraceae bacterium]|nr:hypothetical protein [Lachnospiraceae bacterium]
MRGYKIIKFCIFLVFVSTMAIGVFPCNILIPAFPLTALLPANAPFLMLPAVSVQAAGSDTYTSAVAFYEKYGTGNLVFHEGACYYASRGKAGSGGSQTGIRYGVLGMQFSIDLENMGTYDIGIALEDSDTAGSCKRISYEYKDSYYHSLYKIEYEDITHRLSVKYPELDTNRDLYNQKVIYTVDFYLCVIKDGVDQGDIIEKQDGTIKLSGTVYSDAASIKAAAGWSSETMTALESYFGKIVEVMTPSKWYIDYVRNDDQTRGSMESQTFYYGTGQKLRKNQFKKSHTLNLITGMRDDDNSDSDNPDTSDTNDSPGYLEDQDHEESTANPDNSISSPIVTSYTVDENFLGWIMDGSGTNVPDIDYTDRQEVRDFSRVNDTRYALMPVFQPGTQTLPEASRKSFIFLGWSRTRIDDLDRKPDTNKLKEMEEAGLLKAGQMLTVGEDMTLYAVWARKFSYVRFSNPSDSNNPSAGNNLDDSSDYSGDEEVPQGDPDSGEGGTEAPVGQSFHGTFHYDQADMATIYSIVSRILVPGRDMIQDVISGGYTKNGRG